MDCLGIENLIFFSRITPLPQMSDIRKKFNIYIYKKKDFRSDLKN